MRAEPSVRSSSLITPAPASLSAYSYRLGRIAPAVVGTDAFQRDLLFTLLARGAAASCEEHIHGTDIVLMMVDGFDANCPEDLCLVLIKSTRRTNRLHRFFEHMDPYQLGLWAIDHQPRKSFIRIVLAPFARHGAENFSIGFKRSATYSCYEIVATGLSASIFGCIGGQDEEIWSKLLVASSIPRTGSYDPANVADKQC